MGRILGPRPVQTQFYRTYGDPINSGSHNLKLTVAEDCTADDGGTMASQNYLINGVTLTSIGLSVAAQGMMVGREVTSTFETLDVI